MEDGQPDKPPPSREDRLTVPEGVDPEAFMRALLKVDPKSPPVDADQKAAADEDADEGPSHPKG